MGSELTLGGWYADPSSILARRVGASDLEGCQALGLSEYLVRSRFGFCREIVGEVFRLLVACVGDEVRVMTVPLP